MSNLLRSKNSSRNDDDKISLEKIKSFVNDIIPEPYQFIKYIDQGSFGFLFLICNKENK